jgi:hypothetical protein
VPPEIAQHVQVIVFADTKTDDWYRRAMREPFGPTLEVEVKRPEN